MKPEVDQVMTDDFLESEIIRGIILKIPHLFAMKEKQRQTLGEFLNSELLSFNSPNYSVVRYGLAYELEVIGSYTGRVLLNLDAELAERIAANLFGGSGPVPEEDIHAAMQELLNIFGGHLATALNGFGIDVDITTPELSQNDFLRPQEGRRVLFRFTSHGHILQFMIALKRQAVRGAA